MAISIATAATPLPAKPGNHTRPGQVAKLPTSTMTRKASTTIRITEQSRRELKDLAAKMRISQAAVMEIAVNRMFQQEIKTMTEKHLTDNAWVDRVNELRQIVMDLNDVEAPSTMSDINYMLTSPDAFSNPDFDIADRVVLERELKRYYCIE